MVIRALVAVQRDGVAWQREDLVGPSVGDRTVVRGLVHHQGGQGEGLGLVGVCHSQTRRKEDKIEIRRKKEVEYCQRLWNGGGWKEQNVSKSLRK